MPRFSLAGGALALLVVLAACSTTATPTPSPGSVDTVDAADTTDTAVPGPAEAEPPSGTLDSTSPQVPDATATSSTPATSPGGAVVDPLIAERPVEVIVPDGLDPSTPAALVVVLHGYTGTGVGQDLYFGLRDEAADRSVLLVHPDGTTDARGAQFWNASDACCNFAGAAVDDVSYLTAVVAHVGTIHPVDPQRVFLAGHSNGGFMSYRLACERADLFAAVVSLAGAMDTATGDCAPSRPVSTVQVHGTVDTVIGFDGGEIIGRPYSSAASTVQSWATANGCSGAIDDSTAPAAMIDLDTSIVGAETRVQRAPGCPADGAVELWTIEGGSHIPELGSGFAEAVFDFFDAHPRD